MRAWCQAVAFVEVVPIGPDLFIRVFGVSRLCEIISIVVTLIASEQTLEANVLHGMIWYCLKGVIEDRILLVGQSMP